MFATFADVIVLVLVGGGVVVVLGKNDQKRPDVHKSVCP